MVRNLEIKDKFLLRTLVTHSGNGFQRMDNNLLAVETIKRERKVNLVLISSFVETSAVRCEHVRLCCTELGSEDCKSRAILFWFELLRRQGSFCVLLKQFPPSTIPPSSHILMRSGFGGNALPRGEVISRRGWEMFEVLPGFGSLGLQKTGLVWGTVYLGGNRSPQ